MEGVNLSVCAFVCLIMLSGCSAQTQTITVTKTVEKKVYPPEKWLQDCPYGELKGEFFEDSVALNLEQRAIIKECNVDKKSLRDWVNNEVEPDGSK